MPKFLDVTDKDSAKAVLGVASTRVVSGTGIDLTGATNSHTAFHAILDAAAADAAAGAGTVEVYIPPGTLSLTTRPTIGAGVTLRGAGRGATTIRGSHVNGVLELTGDSDITIADLTVESTATGTTAIGIAATYNGLQKRFSITGCTITGTTNATGGVKFFYAIEQLTFSDNIMEDCASGFGLLAPAYTTSLLSTQIVISGNRFRDVGAVNIQLYGAGPESVNGGNYQTISNVEISGNDLRDFAQTGPNGPIPIEPTGVTNITIANNVIDGTATRGISTGNNVNMTINGNVIRNQSIYAIELNGGKQISIVGNTVQDCAVFAMETGYHNRVTLAGGMGGGGIRPSDIVIADNVYVGSASALGVGDGTARATIRLVTARRVRISGNTFADFQFIPHAIRLGLTLAEAGSPGGAAICEPVPEDVVIESNTFVITNSDTPLRAINVQAAKRTNISRNTLRIHRNLVAGESNAVVIGVNMDPLVSDTLIEDNHIMFTGTVAAATDVAGVGNNPATAAACARMTVRGNQIVNGARGLYLRTTSDDLVVVDNETSTCAGADSFPTTAHSSVGAGSIQLFNAKPGPNYEKLVARYISNVAEIGTMFGGTGAARSLRIGVSANANSTPGASSINRYLQLNSTFPYAQFLTATGGTGSMVQISTTSGGSFTASSGNQSVLAIDPTMNQSSTAGYTMLRINPTETATGSGTKRLIDAAVGGTSKFTVDNTGAVSVSGTAAVWKSGTGSPESVVTAPIGSMFTRTDGGAGTTLYVKESGTGNTGWVAK